MKANIEYKNSNDMKEEIEKLLFETELPSKECEALTQKLLCLYSVSSCFPTDEEIEILGDLHCEISNLYNWRSYTDGIKDFVLVIKEKLNDR